MKKVIVFVVLAAMLLSLCACGKKDEQPAAQQTGVNTDVHAGKFCVGYSRIDITPQTSVPLAGYGRTSERMSKVVRDNMYATAITMRDEDGTVVVFLTMDLQRASDITVNAIRPMVSEQTGIPADHIMIHGTHMHSGPDLNNTKESSIVSYIDYLNPRLVQVILESIADLKPAELYYSSVETEGLVFVKHYQHTTADGEVKYFGDNFGTQVMDATTKHITDADPTLFLLKAVREGGKDIVIANFRGHPTITGGSTKYDISADFPGVFRVALEQQMDCYAAYFTGAGGNLNARSRITSEPDAADVDEHGARLAAHALEGLKNMTKVENTKLQTKQTVLDMECNHTTDNLQPFAKMVQTMWSNGASFSECAAAGEPYGIRSPYYASAIISRVNRPETMDVELNTISIGDEIGICTAPNELFDTNTMYVEDHSPYNMTLTFGYSNGYRGYIPSALGWEYTCYESDCSYFLPGCGETIQNTFLTMFDELYAE